MQNKDIILKNLEWKFGMEKSSSFYISKRSNKNLVTIKVTNDNVEDVILFCGMKYKTDVDKKKKELLVKGYFELDLTTLNKKSPTSVSRGWIERKSNEN